MGLDIGPKTMHAFADALKGAHTRCGTGRWACSRSISLPAGRLPSRTPWPTCAGPRSSAGGDSIAAVKKAGVTDKITHISTGGGASLEWLGGRTLRVAVLPDVS
jgi:phosphoglycerate kinase